MRDGGRLTSSQATPSTLLPNFNAHLILWSTKRAADGYPGGEKAKTGGRRGCEKKPHCYQKVGHASKARRARRREKMGNTNGFPVPNSTEVTGIIFQLTDTGEIEAGGVLIDREDYTIRLTDAGAESVARITDEEGETREEYPIYEGTYEDTQAADVSIRQVAKTITSQIPTAKEKLPDEKIAEQLENI